MRQRSGQARANGLPSVRALAGQLAVNQNTILRVYERLTAEGLLERRHGDGTFVADHVPSGQMKAQRQLLRQQIASAAELAKTLGLDAAELHELLEEPWERTQQDQTMTEPAIELRGISKSYDSRHVLTGLDLSVPKGSVLGLLGTNGAGKTTLVKCALGLIRPQSG